MFKRKMYKKQIDRIVCRTASTEAQTFVADHFKMLSNDVKLQVGCLAHLHQHKLFVQIPS